GRLLYPDFVETVIQVRPMYWVRLIGGTMYLVGVVFMMVNLWMTIRRAPRQLPDPAVAMPRLGPARHGAAAAGGDGHGGDGHGGDGHVSAAPVVA
ncbi:MAG: hypothetical protein AAGJ11_01745, partial [Bacteroidota bacterium]